MPPTSLEQIIPELRDAIGPVILISGVGLLLLTMTNRLGRAIDRARQLKAELPRRTEAEREQVQEQVENGSLVIRQMTDEERSKNQPRPPKPGARPRRSFGR